MSDRQRSPWPRRGLAAVVLIASIVLGSTWFSSSSSEVVAIGANDTLLIVNDAGPVRVRSLESYDDDAAMVDGGMVRVSQSWLLGAPEIEVLNGATGSALRATCPSRFPCRVSLEVFVPDGVELSIVAANDQVQIDAFSGAMSVFAGDGGAMLGDVSGSVSVVSAGPVSGASLGPDELTVEVIDSSVSLVYLDAPTVLSVVGGRADVSIELPPRQAFAVAVDAATVDLAIESDAEAERTVTVQSAGSVSIGPVAAAEDR